MLNDDFETFSKTFKSTFLKFSLYEGLIEVEYKNNQKVSYSGHVQLALILVHVDNSLLVILYQYQVQFKTICKCYMLTVSYLSNTT